jgi:hypothetical protein
LGPHLAIATSATWLDEVDVCGHIVGTSDSTYNFELLDRFGNRPIQLAIGSRGIGCLSFGIEVQMQKFQWVKVFKIFFLF